MAGPVSTVSMPYLGTLPDGGALPGTAYYCNGVVLDWTGRKCVSCNGTGKNPERPRHDCLGGCGGTGEEYAPVWLWEE